MANAERQMQRASGARQTQSTEGVIAHLPLIISLNEYGEPGPCLGTVWADTDNPVYKIEINEISSRELLEELGGNHAAPGVHAQLQYRGCMWVSGL